MKFDTRSKLKDREDEEKIVRKFLWFPTLFDKERKVIWLEIADVVYKIERISGWFVVCKWVWRKDRLATDKDYKTLPFEKPFDGMFTRSSNYHLGGLIIDMLFIALISNPSYINIGLAFLLGIKVIQGIILMVESQKYEV